MFEFEIRKLTAECGCMLTYKISQLLSGLRAADSARSPLRSRSAHMLCSRKHVVTERAHFLSFASTVCPDLRREGHYKMMEGIDVSP